MDIRGYLGPSWYTPGFASLAVCGLVARAEVNALVQEATPTGQYSVGALYGWGQVTGIAQAPTATLRAWSAAAGQFPLLPAWLYLHLAADLLFVAGYWAVGHALLRQDRCTHTVLTVLVGADLLEDGCAAGAFGWVLAGSPAPGWAAWVLHLAVLVKWVALAAFLVRLAVYLWTDPAARACLRRVAAALKVQRFSLVVVALLAVLACARGSDVLEQLPDVQRAWLTWPPSMGWVHLAVAVTAQVLLAALLVFLGRLRTRRARVKFAGADPGWKSASYGPWVVVPGVLGVAALVCWVCQWARVSWVRLIVSAVILLGIALVSKLWRGELPAPRPSFLADRPEVAEWARAAGDMLAVAVIAVTGIGLVRSFTIPALLGPHYRWASAGAVGLGVAVAAGTWPLAHRTVRATLYGWATRSGGGAPPHQRVAYLLRHGTHRKEDDSWWPKAWPYLALGVPLLVVDAFLLFWPLAATHWLGVLGTTVIAISTFAALLTVLAYRAQTRLPLPVFRRLRLNVTPVITVVVAVGVIGALVDSRSSLHGIRGPVGAVSAAPFPAAADNVAAWAAQGAHCGVRAGATADGRTVDVEPLVLVAASGGGIRAAWWTARALSALASTPCGEHAVFAVSAVSGGSLGLAVVAGGSPAVAVADPRPALSRIAGPDALAAAVDGLLLRDMVADVTGLDLTAAQMPRGQRFPDRAALMESAWENEDGGLSRPFPLSAPAVPWSLMFNSTAVATGCRAIISNRRLPALMHASGDDPTATCDLGSTVAAGGAYDFFAAWPCERGISTATAAMLSARFPYITPSGVVPGCRGMAAQQFVDGGYADSSGLSTLSDLAPALMAEVRRYNAAAVSGTPRGGTIALVVPVTVYLGNSARPDPVHAAPGRTPEMTVPTHTRPIAGRSQLTDSDALLQRLFGETGPGQWLSCAAADPGCLAAQRWAAAKVADQVVFASPRTTPRVSAPLGWVLSPFSRQALEAALSGELCPSPDDVPGVGRLGDLLLLIPGSRIPPGCPPAPSGR